jgi:hypothetical protein
MPNSFFNRLNFRKEINALKDTNGFNWAALRSVQLDQNCVECTKSVGAQYDQPSPECKTCMGTGHPYVDKIVKIYRYLSTAGFDHRSPIGNLSTRVDKCYIEHDARPKENDFVLELESNELTGVPVQPFNIIRVFQIEEAHPNRGTDGRIEFWTCTIEERNLELGKSIRAGE